MNPETIKQLQENHPEFIELRAFLASELRKLHSIEPFKDIPRQEREQVLEGRLWAYDTLSAMLLPLLGTSETHSGIDPKEYTVEVP